MKFYKENVRYNQDCVDDVIYYRITAIINVGCIVEFYKNGLLHNTKNAAYINADGINFFYLNDNVYGKSNSIKKSDKNYNAIKQSWRKFVKMQVFL